MHFSTVLRFFGWLMLALLITGAGALLYGFRSAPYSQLGFSAPVAAGSPVNMLFLGTSSMAWTDGKTTWLVDGFFSRQALGQVALTRLKVEESRVLEVAAEAFRQLDVPPVLAGVVVAHSHYDHVLDSPFLVKTFGGFLHGSESTAQIAKGQGLPAAQTKVTGQQGLASFGQFEVKLLESAHAPTGFTGGFNSTPLTLPAHALSFKEGTSYTFLVSHPALGRAPFALIQPSAGFIPGQNKGIAVGTVFLGVGGLGKLDVQYLSDYWREMVLETGAKHVYLIHWDNFTLPLMEQGRPVSVKPMPRLLDDFAKAQAQLNVFAERDGVQLRVLDAWNRVQF